MSQPGVEGIHVPVLALRVVELLAPALGAPGAVFVDATAGMGGHSAALAEACPGVRIIAMDRDPEAIALATRRLAPFAPRVTTVHTVFSEFRDVVAGLGLETVDAVLFDLGVSSLQLDEDARGFAYARDAALDMRMDQGGGVSAAEIVNTYSAAELARVLAQYGEERFAGRVARAIVERRRQRPFARTGELAETVRAAIPAAGRRTGGNPAKRAFQALRIEVNGELAALETALPAALDLLAVGGRAAVLAYHSLEDRIVKRALAAGADSLAPPGLPVEREADKAMLRLLTRGAERPDAAEAAANPRSRSARLRAAEKIRERRAA
jgi:16S rRNA (cytosine1402-N4)-methyltransferase